MGILFTGGAYLMERYILFSIHGTPGLKNINIYEESSGMSKGMIS
jgi:hypothetical protein